MKKFKTESEKVLDIMVNSIYTHKEIFLRELISNASDAIDKLYYRSLKDNLGLSKGDFFIKLSADKENRVIRLADNGIGMTFEELQDNLGTIARSGSRDFKKSAEANEDINIIGQFGVGFYSAFMVASRVEVLSKAYGADKANLWVSEGVAGYDIKEADKASSGTEITLYLKADTEDENYTEFLSEYRLRELIKRYSDYIRYPIRLDAEKTRETGEGEDKKTETYTEEETLNSMIPIWKKRKADIKEEEYNSYYKETFYDYEDPIKAIHYNTEGAVTFKALLYIPSRAPYNYYSKGYEKGLKLYNSDVMIMEKCADLLPDYFSFVKGVVDSELPLNISRETIQHNHQLKKIAGNIEKKVQSELLSLLEKDREKYEKFYNEFGLQLRYGVYEGWGANKDALKDLLLFHSVINNKLISFKEYVAAMKPDQKYIYYAAGRTPEAIKVLPQAEKVLDTGCDILCFTHDVDEFAIKMMMNYDGKDFKSIAASELGLPEDVKPEESDKDKDKDKDMLAFIKEALGDKVNKVIVSSRLKTHPVCLSVEGELSIEMEKVLNSMPASAEKMKAEKVLEINSKHPIYNKLSALYLTDKEALKDYARILLVQAMLIEGMPVDNISEYSDLVCKKLS